MADEKKNDIQNDIPESAAARRIRALGLDTEPAGDGTVAEGNFWENFWYHHKWKTVIISAVVLILTICTLQMCARDTYDVYLMYAGPGYLTPNEIRSAEDAVKQIMPDYNEDGTRGVMFSSFNYLSEAQIAAKMAQAEAEGVDLSFNYVENAAVLDRFDMEVMSGESVIYLLDPALYQSVKYAGGLLPLAEIFDEIPAGAIDEYGIRLGDTQLYKSFSVLQALPADTVLCLRRITTMAVFKGKAKTEQMHAWHTDLFEKMATFALDGE